MTPYASQFPPLLRDLLLACGSLACLGLAACNRATPAVASEDVALGLLRLGEPRLVTIDVPRADASQLKFSCDCVRVVDDGNASTSTRRLIFQPEKPGRLDVELRVETSRGRIIKQVRFLGWVAAARPDGLVAAENLADGTDSLLVDVRSDFRKSQVRVPRALSLPLRALARRVDWKDRKLILLGDGLDESDLLREAQVLRTAGFQSVQVLDGGVPAWLAAGGKGEGTAAAIRETSMVRAGEVLASSSRGQAWIVLVPADSDEKSWPGGFTVVRGDPKDRGIEEVLAASAAATKTAPHVLVADPAFATDGLRGLSVFRLAEPLSALRSLAPNSTPTLMTISSEARDRSGSLRAAGSGCGGCPGR